MAHAASAGDRGVINDPDGFTNVRSGQSADAAIIAKVKTGEVFEFDAAEGSPWWKVTLASGKSGWMHHSRIRCHFTLDEIPEKDEEGSEVAYYGDAHGFDYCATAHAAAKGDLVAMKRYFGINDTDGGAGEMHAYYFGKVMHLVGDEKLATFLKTQPLDYQIDVRNELAGGFVLWPFEANSYTERNFPQVYHLLCRKEVTDWPSPDGRYAIHKVFSEARVTENSKVVKAELVEKASGKPVTDLTADDTGFSTFREGKVLWAPDSKRFAFFSGSVGGPGGQTVVYEKQADGTFTRLNLPDVELPGRANDAELKGTEHLWRFVEPQRWEKPDVLVLQLHDYFEGFRSDRSIRSLGRTYFVTRDFSTGKATAVFEPH